MIRFEKDNYIMYFEDADAAAAWFAKENDEGGQFSELMDEVYDNFQIIVVGTLYQFGKLLHTATFVLAEVRVDVIIIGDSVWATCFAFDNCGCVVLRGGMADDTCVPHMRSAQVANSAKGFRGDSIQGSTTILLQRTIMFARFIIVGKCTR